MSYTFTQTGSEIQAILDRAEAGGQIDQDIAAKQDQLTFDAVPTEGSTNPAESGGIYDAIQAGGATALAAFATDSVSGDVVSFPDGADGIPVKSFVGSILPVQSGSGDPAPDNIRPISGWTGATAYRMGVNVWDEQWEVGGYDNTTGAATVATTQIRSKATSPIPVKPNTDYCFSAGNSRISNIYWYDANDAFISRTANAQPVATYTSPANAWYCRFKVAEVYGTTYNHDISINYPSTDTTYHAYDGQTILLTFGSTVYAGTITALGGGKWSIQPTHGVITYNGAAAESWTLEASGRCYIENDSVAKLDDYSTAILCDKLKTVERNGVMSSTDYCISGYKDSDGSYPTRNWIYAKADDTITSANAFKTWLAANPITVVYPLATLPDPIIVTAEDLQTLLGANTVWTDVGAVTGMTYRADTALYIQKLIGGGTLQTLSMASPSPSLSLGRVGVLAEQEEAEPEEVTEEPEADTEEATEE